MSVTTAHSNGHDKAQIVILSGAGTSRSEAPAESKDPYSLRAQQGSRRELSRSPVWSGHSCPLPLPLLFSEKPVQTGAPSLRVLCARVGLWRRCLWDSPVARVVAGSRECARTALNLVRPKATALPACVSYRRCIAPRSSFGRRNRQSYLNSFLASRKACAIQRASVSTD